MSFFLLFWVEPWQETALLVFLGNEFELGKTKSAESKVSFLNGELTKKMGVMANHRIDLPSLIPQNRSDKWFLLAQAMKRA
jgi:hypothetical protein